MDIKYKRFYCLQCSEICKDYGLSIFSKYRRIAVCNKCNIIIWYSDIYDTLYAFSNGLYIDFPINDKVYSLNDFERILKMKAFL